MKKYRARNLSRRQIIKGLASTAAAGAFPFGCTPDPSVGAGLLTPRKLGQVVDGDQRFLIVLAATGGASIIDSFMAIRESESANGAILNTFPDAMVQSVPGSALRAVDQSFPTLGAIPLPFSANQSNFANKHKDDIMVVTQTSTSVNHTVGQKRSLNGNAAWNGRTLQEAVAQQYGEGFAMPNVNMGFGGFLEEGGDGTISEYARQELVTDALLYPLGLHGSKGILGAPNPSRINRARLTRAALEQNTRFAELFGNSPVLARWLANREDESLQIEGLDLITNLNALPDLPPTIPLTDFGLDAAPGSEAVRAAFPDFFADPIETQAGLAFLMLKNRITNAVTISPSLNAVVTPATIKNPPLSFDFSHQAHRGAQAFMWDRILSVADRLIDLLKTEPFGGGNMWERSLIYVATDFGRSKGRAAGDPDFGSGHNLNNGMLVISPLANGNTVLGGVEPDTAMTYGFNPITGDATPGEHTSEVTIYSGLLGALGIDTSGSGLPDVPAMRRA